jgi:hypothetical protein
MEGDDYVASLPNIESYRKNDKDGHTLSVSTESLTDCSPDSSTNFAEFSEEGMEDEQMLYNAYPPLLRTHRTNYSKRMMTPTDAEKLDTEE